MPPRLSRQEISSRALTAIADAHRDYADWSGGQWLWFAPEYLQTVYIARALAKDKVNFVTLEDGVRGTLKKALAIGPGRPAKELRIGGRIDIVLWRLNDTPRGIIEVKRNCSSYEQVRDDVLRIRAILEKRPDKNTIDFGAVSFFTAYDSPGPQEPKIWVRDAIESIVDDARVELGPRFRVKPTSRDPRADQDGAWLASYLEITRAI